MKSRKELIQEYKERRKPAGVFIVRNTVNGKVLLGSSLNLEGPVNSHRFMLRSGNHKNKALQADWSTYGEDSFTFEIVETLPESTDPAFNIEDELTLLEEIPVRRRRRRRRPDTSKLRRVDNPIAVPEQQRPCPICGQQRRCIGHDESEVIDFIPAEVVSTGDRSFVATPAMDSWCGHRWETR